ncbi:MAG: glycosyltransferase family 4 protein [Gemmatimonadetes bacterium]|nr:glycosyltransferase family 4 protein [Gemmatimonadota bacterium]
MHVVHLSSAHSAFDTRILYKECVALADDGHTVVYAVPHHEAASLGDVRIAPLAGTTGRLHRMTTGTWAAYRAARALKADVYHLHDPELIPVGMLLKLHGSKVVYDAHEDLPQQVHSKDWIPRPGRALVAMAAAALEAAADAAFDAVVAATPTIQKRFRNRNTTLVRNFPVLEPGTEAAATYLDREPLVAYVGNITVVRGVHEMAAAISLLPAELGARLVMAGRFQPASLETEFMLAADPSRVEFVGWQSRAGVRDTLERCRVGLIVLHPLTRHQDALPVKLFEYMAAGLPVVASDFPLWREIVGGAGCGLLVDPLDPAAIARALGWLLAHPAEAGEMGRRGRVAVETTYSWCAEGEVLKGLYRRLASGPTPTGGSGSPVGE